MANKLKTVRINRKKWARGNSETNNKLLLRSADVRQMGEDLIKANRSLREGNMCCLGFACLALGASKSAIAGKAMPDEVYRKRILEGLVEHPSCPMSSTDFAQAAAEINDDRTITNQQRERKLTKLSRQHGFNFVFFGRTK